MTDAQDAAVAKGHVYPRLDPGLEDRIAAYIQDRDRSREQSLVAGRMPRCRHGFTPDQGIGLWCPGCDQET